MHLNLFGFVALIITCAAISPARAQTTGATYTYRNSSLSRYYTLDETTGNAVDSVTNQADMTLSSGATYQQNMGLDGAGGIYFAGGVNDTSRASLPNMTIGGALTFTATVRFDSTAPSWQRIFDFGNGASAKNILFGQDGNSTKLRFEIWTSAGVFSAVTGVGAIIPGETAHFAATVTSSGTMMVYKNGVALTLSNGQTSFAGRSPELLQRTINVLGDSNWISDSSLTGIIADFTIHNATLSQTEIAKLYQVARYGLTHVLDGTSGNDVINSITGNDLIDGSAGTGDIAVFTGAWKDYNITLSNGTYSLVKKTTGETDSITNVEIFRFSNGDFPVADILNDAPSITTASPLDIDETISDTESIVTIASTDSDASLGDTKIYSIITDASGLFKIDSVSGVLMTKTGTKLNYRVTPSYQITLRVTDAGGATGNKILTINLRSVTLPSTSVSYLPVSDPVNNSSNPKNIPGSIFQIKTNITNNNGAPDAGSFSITLDIGSVTDIYIGNLQNGLAVLFTDGTPSCGLTPSSVTYLNGSGTVITPTSDGNGYTNQVAKVKIDFAGQLSGNTTGTAPNCDVRVQARLR